MRFQLLHDSSNKIWHLQISGRIDNTAFCGKKVERANKLGGHLSQSFVYRTVNCVSCLKREQAGETRTKID